MSTPFISRPVDCPACGAAACSRLATAEQGRDGFDLRCEVCDFFVFSGTVVDRGRELARETVVRRVRALRPWIREAAAYVEPWDRLKVLGLVSADTGLASGAQRGDDGRVVVVGLEDRQAGVA
jgi:hypothetical protein